MPATPSWRAEHARRVLAGWVDRLPPRMRRVVTPEMVGFALLGLLTFAVDLVLLAVLERWTPLPLPISVTLAYAVAFGLNYLLNRTLNFRSHAPVGPQLARFTLVIGCDFGITLGVTTGLSGLGVDFRIARVVAGACVAVFTYSACRWWVFRDTLPPSGTGVPPQTAPRMRSGWV
ncbi:MAG: GtrA family protein [Pseudonocardiaceae bacterium]|nr:GtrA family protein [Pseudonocardiaceae bacterium]